VLGSTLRERVIVPELGLAVKEVVARVMVFWLALIPEYWTTALTKALEGVQFSMGTT